MSEWQPIETAPKDGSRILIPAKDEERNFTVAEVSFVGGSDSGDVWYERRAKCNHYSPIQWMPLPEPPK